MPQLKFQIYTFLGSWPWCFALAYVGMRLGEEWESNPELRDILHRFDAVIIGALVLALAWYVRRHWRHRLISKP
jgi:membrane protein DedA with SNARE-associated domain